MKWNVTPSEDGGRTALACWEAFEAAGPADAAGARRNPHGEVDIAKGCSAANSQARQ